MPASRSLTLRWSAPSQVHRNGIITQYRVQVTSSVPQSISTMNTMITVEGLHPYTYYSYKIAASTSAGQGPFTGTYQIRTLQAAPSGPPLNQRSQAAPRSLTLQWSAPSQGHRNGIIRQYTVRVTSPVSLFISTTNTMITVEGLHPYTDYSYKIAASTSAGLGPFTGIQGIRTLEAAPSGPPLNQRSQAAPRSLTLRWSAPSLRNGRITQYTVQVTRTDTGESETHYPTDTMITVEGLHPYTYYSYRIAASTSVGQGPLTRIQGISTLEAAPGRPPLIEESKPAPRSLTLRWSAPSQEHQNGRITNYTVQVNMTDTGESETHYPTDIMITVEGLHPYTHYSYRIAASTSAGQGPFTGIRHITTDVDVPSGLPLNVTGNALSPTSLVLEWIPPSEEERNGPLTGYSVILQWEVGQEHRVDTAGTNYTFTELQQNTTYHCSIAAHTSVGTGPYYNATITTLTVEPDHYYILRLVAGISGGIILLLILCVISSIPIARYHLCQKYHGRMTISVHKNKKEAGNNRDKQKGELTVANHRDKKKINRRENASVQFIMGTEEDRAVCPNFVMPILLEKVDRAVCPNFVMGTLPTLFRNEDHNQKEVDTMPQLPERTYLEDKAFLRKLDDSAGRVLEGKGSPEQGLQDTEVKVQQKICDQNQSQEEPGHYMALKSRSQNQSHGEGHYMALKVHHQARPQEEEHYMGVKKREAGQGLPKEEKFDKAQPPDEERYILNKMLHKRLENP